MVTRLTPEARRALTRDTLIDAAAEVFARKGYAGASLDEIADNAGFTRGAIYSNFEGKEDLLFAVFAREYRTSLSAFADAIASSAAGDIESAALAGREATMATVSGSSDSLALAFEVRLHALRHPETAGRIAVLLREQEAEIAASVSAMLAEKQIELALPVADVVSIASATVESLLLRAAIDEERADHYERLVTMLLDLLISVARAPSAT